MLDRKNYESAIPQLEKKIGEIESGQKESGINYDAFREKTEKELKVVRSGIVDNNALIIEERERAIGVEGIKADQTDLNDLSDTVEETQTAVSNLDIRVQTAEGQLGTVETNIANLGNRVTTAEGNLQTVESAIGNPSDTASASGSLYARVKNVKNVADGAETAINQEVIRAQAAEQRAETAAANAQAAAEASIEANYRKYNAISLTQTQIDSLCAHGSVNSWDRASAEGYYQGACNVGDVLLIYVTKPDTNVGKLLVRVTTDSSAGQPTTGETISWDDNINVYFWHDSNGAHILGANNGYRTDLDGDSIDMYKGSTKIAEYSQGLTVWSDNGTEIAHLGYGTTQGESGPTTSPYYDLGVRKANTTKGSYSVAEGFDTTASGYYTHAEGADTIASGYYSHAGGYKTTASGHYSHTEGVSTKAIGNCSHAEGSGTTASGHDSHAEGIDTTASGGYSHAEGYGTIAAGHYSHAQGKYNVENASHIDIVGNGTDETRSNAYALEYTGTGRYRGDVYVRCNKDSTGGTKLAKISEIPTSMAWDSITNKPSFSTVATSGSYNDLSNKPTIPTTMAWDSITGKPSTFTPSSHTHTKSQITDYSAPSIQVVQWTGVSCSANNYKQGDQAPPTVAGKTAIGVVGFTSDKEGLVFGYARISGGNVGYRVRNVTSSAISGATITLHVLYV